MRNNRVNRGQKGQSIILIALAFVALLAFVGLAMDAGTLFIFMGHLRRAVDAASLSAAAQYREGRTYDQLVASAEEVMNLNGVDPEVVQVQTCDTNPGDPGLCFTPPRKMVRVIGQLNVPMSFLQLIGIPTLTISANAIGEAASMDVVLVIDISESMAWDASRCDGDSDDIEDNAADDGRTSDLGCGPAIAQVGSTWDDYYRDPSRCNPALNCEPFEKVKSAAISFVDRILDKPAAQEADRLAIVTFSNGWQTPGNSRGTRVVPPGWMTDHTQAVDAINNLEVYQPDICPTDLGPCLLYDSGTSDGNFLGFGCPTFDDGGNPNYTGNPATCTSTNIGGGLRLAGNMYADNPREEALWVTVLLTDGAANSSDPDNTHPYGYCPDSTWDVPFCRDRDTLSRHSSGNPAYDADDYARDMADFVGCYGTNPAPACNGVEGQGAVIFAIGLGEQVLKTYNPDPVPAGVRLLRYVAAVGDDGNSATDLCAGLYDNEDEWKTWCGNYYYSPTGDQLDTVFEDIASRIFTRITH
jgi:hypothetical protein